MLQTRAGPPLIGNRDKLLRHDRSMTVSSIVLVVAAAVALVAVVAIVLVLARRGRPSAPALPPATSTPSSPTAITCPFCKREYEPNETAGRCPGCGAAAPRR